MSNIVIRELMRRLDELEAEFAPVKARYDDLTERITYYRGAINDFAEYGNFEGGQQLTTKDLRDQMVKVLEDAGIPLHYKFIYERLNQAGIKVPGEDPVRNTGAHLSGDDRFESLRQGIWGLSAWNHNKAPASRDADDLPF